MVLTRVLVFDRVPYRYHLAADQDDFGVHGGALCIPLQTVHHSVVTVVRLYAFYFVLFDYCRAQRAKCVELYRLLAVMKPSLM